MKAVGVAGLGLSEQEEQMSKLHAKTRFESKFRFIRIIANYHARPRKL